MTVMPLRAPVCLWLASAATASESRRDTTPRDVGRDAAAAVPVGRAGRERVINGNNAPKGVFPWMAALIRKDSGGFFEEDYEERHLCGGSLIAPEWVLTAAHCVETCVETGKEFPSTVVLGAWHLLKWPSEDYGFRPEEIAVDDVILHEKHYLNPEKGDGGHEGPYDIALLHLARPSSLTPIEIASTPTRTMVGDPVDLLGWGRLGADDDDYPVKLQMAELVVLPTRDCGPDHANTVELCVGDPEDEQNAASGDSGGPLFIQNEQNAYEQIGLVSRGSTYVDDATDVVALKDWIDAEIAAWGRTTLTDCGACESALDAKLGKTNSAEACWVQCLAKYVEDHFDEQNLVAVDWYPDSRNCYCESACDLRAVDKDVVIVVRDEALAQTACAGPGATPRPTSRVAAAPPPGVHFSYEYETLQKPAAQPTSRPTDDCPSGIKDEYGNCVDEGCASWFDGCNTCFVGAALGCTEMYCETPKEPKCLDANGCADDATWHHKNRGPDFDCAWVAQKPDTRCAVNGVVTSEDAVVVARDACAAACGGCDDVVSALSSTKAYAEVGRVCRPKNDDGYATTTVADAAACRALCDADATCGAWEYENYFSDELECELHEAGVVDAEATAAQGPCQTSDPNNYRCCHIDESLIGTPPPTTFVLDNESLRAAVSLWFSDRNEAIETYGDISSWKTGEVTDLSTLFAYQSTFNANIAAWDTSAVTTTESMFYGASAFNQYLGGWRVGAVTTMTQMFYDASSFNQPMQGWDTSSVRAMDQMFRGSAFDQPVNNWDVSRVTSMLGMFAKSPFDRPLNTWDVGRVRNMEALFDQSAFNRPLDKWRVASVTNMYGMFYGAASFAQELGWCVGDGVLLEDAFNGTRCEATSCGVVKGNCSITGYVMEDGTIRTAVAAWFSDSAAAEATYGHISSWNTGDVTDMSRLFCASKSLSECNWPGASSFNEDISAWDTSGVTSMFEMFGGARAFNQYLGDWAVDNVISMRRMFRDASSFNQDIGSWAVNTVTRMEGMFQYASAFDQDLGWCVSWAEIDLAGAFEGTLCELSSCGVQTMEEGTCAPTSAPTATPAPTVTPKPTATPLTADDRTIRTAVAAWLSDAATAETTYGHISTWDTSGVTDMAYLFEGASSFNEGISAWDTSGVTTMEWMFNRARSFDQDLGWCVGDDVDLFAAFRLSACESTSCGVAQGQFKTEDGSCESTPAPTPGTDAALRGGRVATALVVVGGVMAALL